MVSLYQNMKLHFTQVYIQTFEQWLYLQANSKGETIIDETFLKEIICPSPSITWNNKPSFPLANLYARSDFFFLSQPN